ncbi:hypothetical protein CJF32_00000969 [Rutstroemia sp. NJR-2017a WRK4]|nr:hypothetical protein CJF32_00000969 [Rutstroemia sp. NJR-2017a WRK4]
MQQYIFGLQYLYNQWMGMFFDYIRQGLYIAGEYRVYRAVFAGCR